MIMITIRDTETRHIHKIFFVDDDMPAYERHFKARNWVSDNELDHRDITIVEKDSAHRVISMCEMDPY